MNASQVLRTLWNHKGILESIILTVVSSYFLKIYLRRRRLVRLANTLPSLRLKFYHLLGHVSIILTGRWYTKLPQVPLSCYDFQALTGYSFLFSKGNLLNIWQLHIPFVVAIKAESVEVILSHSTELKKAWFYEFLHPWLGKGLLTSEGEKWKMRRRMLTPSFHFNILQNFLTVFQRQSQVLVDVMDKYTDQDHVDIVPLITNCSLDIICESILGAEMHTQTETSSPYVKAIVKLTAMFLERMQSPWLWNDFIFKLSPFGRLFLKNVRTVDDFTAKLISDRKQERLLKSYKSDDSRKNLNDNGIFKRKNKAFLDLLMDEHIKNPEELSEEAIREEVNTFAFEGHDTTSTAMAFSLYLIGLHPWVQDKIQDELDSIFGEDDTKDPTLDDLKNMKYLECVIKETLRLYPSVPAFGRLMQEDIAFQGYTVPKGSTLMVLVYQLHRDPEVFPNPEKFDPERFAQESSSRRHPYAYVPFSAGPRNCIGQRFALLEAKTVLSTVLRKYKVRSLDPRDKVFLMDEVVLRSAKGLRVQLRTKNQQFDFHSIYYRA